MGIIVNLFSGLVTLIIDLGLKLYSGSATILTGAIAIGIYFYQKNDTKKQTARIILIEIRTAEDRINKIKDQILNNHDDDFPTVLISNNWKKYSHLFVSDFDDDEMKLMNSFYNCCEIIDDFCKRNNNFFWITAEEKSKLLQQTLARTIENKIDEKPVLPSEEFKKTIDIKKDLIQSAYDYHGFIYKPKKILDEINKQLSKAPIITTSTCGAVLKRIAKFK